MPRYKCEHGHVFYASVTNHSKCPICKRRGEKSEKNSSYVSSNYEQSTDLSDVYVSTYLNDNANDYSGNGGDFGGGGASGDWE